MTAGHLKVSIILLNWNGWKYTVDCLESLLKVSDVGFEVIVVDNGSTDESVKMIEDWIEARGIPEARIIGPEVRKVPETGGRSGMARVILLSLKNNLGFAGGNNVGLRQSLASVIPYALILNNDTLVDKNFLFPLVEYAESHPEAGLVGGQIRYAADPERIWHMGDWFNWSLGSRNVYRNKSISGVPAEPFRAGWISGCMSLIPLPVFSKTGGYEEKFFIYSEDWDLSLRVLKAGYELAVVPSSVIYHKVSKTLGRTSPFVYYYSGRNLFLLWFRHLPKWRAVFLSLIYLPYKFSKGIYFSAKYKSPYIIFFFEMLSDAVFGRYGKWRRHDEIAEIMKRKKYGN